MSLATFWALMIITVYNNVPGQTDSTPDIAACGPVKACTVAVTRTMFKKKGFHCGRRVFLSGISKCGGFFHVNDKLNKRYQEDRVDILYAKHEIQEALDFGVQSSRVILLDF